MVYEGIINIGLHVGGGAERITVQEAVDALNKEGVIVMSDATVAQSDSEPTLVASVVFPDITDWFGVCAELRQEAIALLLRGADGSHAGLLVGPKAEAWGPFDPALFIMQSGKRLSDVLAQSGESAA